MTVVERIQLIFEGINKMTAPVRAVSKSLNQVEMDTQAYQNVAANSSLTVRESAKFFRENNLAMQNADTAVNTLTGQTQSLGQVTQQAGKEAKRFNFSWLSVMFAGMALNRVFGGLIKSQLKLFGITELLGGAFTLVMLPVMMMLLPLFLWLSQIMMNLSPEMKIVVGVLIVVAAIFGLLLLVGGQLMLAIMGLGSIFGIFGVLALLAVLGIVLILIGLGFIIAGIIIIVQNWGKDWGKVMLGMGIALIGLGVVALGVFAIMTAAGVTSAVITWAAWTAGISLIVGAFILLGSKVVSEWDDISAGWTVIMAKMHNKFTKFRNGIIDGILAVATAWNNFMPDVLEINVSGLESFKTGFIDINALKNNLKLDRNLRIAQEQAMAEFEAKKLLPSLDSFEAALNTNKDISSLDSLIPDQFNTSSMDKQLADMQQEINIYNNNTFNVPDATEMQAMLDENTSKMVEDIKRQINP